MGNHPLRMKIRQELHPSGVAAAAESDPELTAVLSRAAARSGLEASTPPSPEPSRRDDWLLGTGRGSRPRSALVPFFPEVHEELMKLWTAPFYGQKRLVCLLHPRYPRWRAARGYVDIPQVESAVAVHLCLQNAATWRNCPHLSSKACKLTAALTAKAYSAAGQAASALHAMAILRVHQAKALNARE